MPQYWRYRKLLLELLVFFIPSLFIVSCTPLKNNPTTTTNGDPLFQQAEKAIYNSDVSTLTQLLNQHPYLANARDTGRHDGQTLPRSLLHILAEPPGHRQKRQQIARLLVERGCDINNKLHYSHGETPLHWAAQSGDVQLIEAFIQLGATIDAEGSRIENGSPLVNAIHFGHTRAAQTLVDLGATVFNFPLAAGLGRKDLMNEFIDYGGLKPTAARTHPQAHPAARLTHGNTRKIYLRAFAYAVFNHQFKIADELLQSGVDINQQWGKNNYSLLHRVAQRGTKAMAEYLVSHGANANLANTSDRSTPQQIAKKHNNTRVELLLNKVASN